MSPRPARLTAAIAATALAATSFLTPAVATGQSMVLPGYQVNPNYDPEVQVAFSVKVDNVREYPEYTLVDLTLKNREAWDINCSHGTVPAARYEALRAATVNRSFVPGSPELRAAIGDVPFDGYVIPHEFSWIPERIRVDEPSVIVTACSWAFTASHSRVAVLVTPIVKGTETATSGPTKEKGTPQPFDPEVVGGIAEFLLQSESVKSSPLGSLAPALGSGIDAAVDNAGSLQASSLNPLAGR